MLPSKKTLSLWPSSLFSEQMVADYNYPVGIEWQGLFEDTLDEETQDGDYGHYGVVTMVDPCQKLVIVDPYKDFRSHDRIFTFEFFMSMWWATNDFPDPQTGNDLLVEDRQMMFVITPEEVTFPLLLDMKRG